MFSIRILQLATFFVSLSYVHFAFSIDMDMATPYPNDSFHTQNILQFTDDLKNATDGVLNINVHSANSLVAHNKIKSAVASGQIQIGEFFLSSLSKENGVFALDTIPFRANSYSDAFKLWRLQKKKIVQHLNKQGLKVLFAVPWPPQGLYTKATINKFEDIRQLRIRSYNDIMDRFIELLGAKPVRIEVTGIKAAFLNSEINAMITSSSSGVGAKSWQFTSTYMNIQAWLPKNIVVMNMDRYLALPKRYRQAIDQSAHTAEKRGWKMSNRENAKKIEILRKNGVIIVEPSERFISKIKAISKLLDDSSTLTITACEGMSDTVLPPLIEQYRIQHGTPIRLIRSDSQMAMEGVVDFATDMAGACVQNPDKFTTVWNEKLTPFAWEPMAVITNDQNPTANLSKADLRKLLKGKLNSWMEVGGDNQPIIGMQEVSAAIREGLDAKNEAYFFRLVEENKQGIGFVRLSAAKANGVKILKINKFSPSSETIKSLDYPLYRAYYLVTSRLNTSFREIELFENYLFSSNARQIMAQNGLLPYLEAPLLGVQLRRFFE